MINIKKLSIVLFLSILGLFLLAGNSIALPTPILSSPGELDLLGTDGILDQIYGIGNLQRVDDDGDKTWFPANGCATPMAKYAGFDQDFGFIPDLNEDSIFDESFVDLFSVTGDGLNLGPPTATFSSGDVGFLWALKPSGAPMWTSRPSYNSDGLDHMTTWRVLDTPNTWVIAWEDLPGGGDKDYNDLVVEVSVWATGEPQPSGTCPSCPGTTPVPEPTTMFLLGVGLLALSGARRKFMK